MTPSSSIEVSGTLWTSFADDASTGTAQADGCALLPSLGPTTPRDSSRSISRPALANPTRSLRCSIEVDPNWVFTISSAACSSSSRSSPMSSSITLRSTGAATSSR